MKRVRLCMAFLAIVAISEMGRANAFVRGAYYRLGDDDTGAAAGAAGNNPTLDSFSSHIGLSRFSSPHYSSDVPPNGPFGNKLSMAFANNCVGPTAGGYYGALKPLDMTEQAHA